MNRTSSEPTPCAPPYLTPEQEQTRWFAEHVYPHDGALRSWLRRQFPQLSEVDDVVQESYLRVLRARQLGPIASTRAYLFVIARNAALGVFRRQRDAAHTPVSAFDAAELPETNSNVVDIVNSQQECRLAIEAIDALPARCREIVTLRVVQGLTHKEIAAQLGLAEQTVRVQVARGMKRCAELLRAKGVQRGGADGR